MFTVSPLITSLFTIQNPKFLSYLITRHKGLESINTTLNSSVMCLDILLVPYWCVCVWCAVRNESLILVMYILTFF